MRLIALLALAVPVWAVGTVSQSTSQLGTTNTWVVALNFTGDPSTGSVPTTAALLGGCCQGFIYTSVEVIPKSPAPSSGWTLKIQDTAGADILAGGGANLSATAPVSLAPSAAAAPVNGTFSIVVTGQSVAGAQASIYVYLSKPGSVNVIALTKGGGSGGGGGGGSGVTSFNSRTGVVFPAGNDYNALLVAGVANNVSFAATPTFDMSTGNIQRMTLSGTVTGPILTSLLPSLAYMFILCQDSTGGHSFTWPATVHGGMSIGLFPSTCSAQVFVSPDAVNLYALGSGVTNQ